MFERISLSRKLAAMVVVPVIALIVLGGLDLARRTRQAGEMRRLEELTRLAMEANRLASALHRERSLSAGALTAAGTTSADLEQQQASTDLLVARFRTQVAAMDEAILGEELAARVGAAVEALEALPAHRHRLAAGELTTAEAVSSYNDLTAQLLPVVTLVSERSSHAEIRTMLQSLDMLARLKEAADLERAALNVAFTADTISTGLLQAAVNMNARQELLQTIFLAHAPKEIAESFQAHVVDAFSEEMESVRFEASDGVGRESLGIDPGRWWRVSSSRIDDIAKIEDELAGRILGRVVGLRSSARRGAWIGTLAVLLAVGGAVGLSTYVGRGVNRSLGRASETISEAVTQISTSVQQLSASTGETAAAVSQTSTTVDELRQTSEAAATKAEATSAAADESRGASLRAEESATRGVEAMEDIRTEVEGIAQRIVDLSERNAQISDIVQNVNAIAEQSNLLAVNASIEAAKAGEHGRGFAVVANEVKTLAERSKEATEQIRSILGEIQNSSNAAVMATEQGVKRVDEGSQVIDELGRAIQSLTVTIQDNSDAAEQISLISRQQLTGIEQITEALHSVEQAATDNASGAGQLESAADRLASVSGRIITIVQGSDGPGDGR
jgi:methyl-accepting chemotaxis protein